MKKPIYIPVLALFLIFYCTGCEKEEIDTESPTVLITYPPNNSQFPTNSLITVKCDAADNEKVLKVEFFIDGDRKRILNDQPFQYEWDTKGLIGKHTLNIKAYDPSENVGTSELITVDLLAAIPSVSTDTITNITVKSAKSGGKVTADGGSSVTSRGVCWNTEGNPTISDNKTIDGSGTGSFKSTITGLTHFTTYYVRAYATNQTGTAYGSEQSFRTNAKLPTVITSEIINITDTSALGGGEVIDDGGSFVFSRGVCWSRSSIHPTIEDSKTEDGSGYGPFLSSMIGLKNEDSYYVRAYAINELGVSYGDLVQFFTTIKWPKVKTLDVTNITESSAIGGGEILDQLADVSAKGICWSTSPNPTIEDHTTYDGYGTEKYISFITGLEDNRTYYVRAFATNTAKTAYGIQMSFTTLKSNGTNDILFNPNLTYGSVTDINGNTYKTIVIGNQEWMAENLRVTKYPDGKPIPIKKNADEWNLLEDWYVDIWSSFPKAFCYYDDDPANAKSYGALYTWAAAEEVCPTGWHLPSDEEWKELEIYLGMSQSEADDMDYRGNIGDRLKEMGSFHWYNDSYTIPGTNSSGFTALPGSGRAYINMGEFYSFGQVGIWWTSTRYPFFSGQESKAWDRSLIYDLTGVGRHISNIIDGHSVRCVRD